MSPTAGRARRISGWTMLAAGMLTIKATASSQSCRDRLSQPEVAGPPMVAPCAQAGLEWVNSATDPGMNDRVLALAVFDDGNGPALYAGGSFTSVNGVSANRIARWDGVSWTALDSGLDMPVYGLTVFDPPGPAQGPGLYACGVFDHAGGGLALSIARWDGFAWSALGSGTFGSVDRMTAHDDGTSGGTALYVTGQFPDIGGAPNTRRIARWNGTAWSALGTGLDDSGNDVVSWDEDGSGPNPPRLFAGGYFLEAGDLPAPYIARWDGANWSSVEDAGGGLNEHVHAFQVFDDGSGPALYVGGHFTQAGANPVKFIARWDGAGWSPVGAGLHGEVLAMAVFDDRSGGGPQLYAGGFFAASVDDPQARFVAKWDGTRWVNIGGGVNDAVWNLATFDDGTGNGTALYAAGWFTQAGTLTSRRLAQWNGVGDVDLDDYAGFAACLAGPGQTLPPGCGPADCDGDSDADLLDFASIQAVFTGT